NVIATVNPGQFPTDRWMIWQTRDRRRPGCCFASGCSLIRPSASRHRPLKLRFVGVDNCRFVKHSITRMTKTITKVGNSQGIIFDAALMDLARVKVGDQVNVTVVPESGAIVLMPLRPGPSKQEISSVIKKTARDYRKTLRKLA